MGKLYEQIDEPKLKDKPFNPRIPAQLASSDDIFSIIRRGDVLVLDNLAARRASGETA